MLSPHPGPHQNIKCLSQIIIILYVDPFYSLSLCAKMTSWFNYWGHMCLIFELLGEDDDDDEDGDDGNDGKGSPPSPNL